MNLVIDASVIVIALDIGSTVYDAFYVALAVDLDTAVATADQRLVDASSRSSWRNRVTYFAGLARS